MLLLLLTALFASLTGGVSGECSVRQVQGVATVRATEVAQAAVRPFRRVAQSQAVAVAVAVAVRPERTVHSPLILAMLPTRHLPFERRLE